MPTEEQIDPPRRRATDVPDDRDALPTFAQSRVVRWLLFINIAVHVLDGFGQVLIRYNGQTIGVGWLSAYGWFDIGHTMAPGGGRELWRLFTYQFLHANLFHLGMNMMALYVFGPMMEKWWGGRRFLVFYLLCGACGAWFMAMLILISYKTGLDFMNAEGWLVGASGSIFGLLVGVALIAPKLEVKLIIPPMWVTVRRLAIIFGAISLGGVLFDWNGGGNAAHLGGAIFGYILVKRPWSLDWADSKAPRLEPPGKDGDTGGGDDKDEP